jgi:hypothetical protein
MSSNYSGNPNNFLPENYIIPDEIDQKDVKIREYLNNISIAVNKKDSGIYDSIETITGQSFLPTFSTSTSSNTNYRTVFRKTIDFGSLPNTTTKSVAHGIIFGTTFSTTKIYGSATDPTNSFIPLPYSSPTLANNIELNLDGTNVNIITGSDRTSYTRSFVIIEYIKVV